MNRDEKGRISPAQSSVAKSMRKPLLPMSDEHRSLLGKTMGGIAKEQEEKYNYSKAVRRDPNPGRYNYGGATKANHRKKLKIIARGRKKDFHTGPAAMKKKGYEGV